MTPDHLASGGLLPAFEGRGSNNFPSIRNVLWTRPMEHAEVVVLGWRSYVPALKFTSESIRRLACAVDVARSSRPTMGFISQNIELAADSRPPTSAEDPYSFELQPSAASTVGAVRFTAVGAGSASTAELGGVYGYAANPSAKDPLSAALRFTSLQTADDYRVGSKVGSLHIEMRLVSPTITLRFRYLVLPPRLAPDSAVASALLTSGLQSLLSPISGLQCGPMTMDAQRRVIPLIPNDPLCRTTPLVGMWIRAPVVPEHELEEDPHSRAAAIPAWARTALRHPGVRAAVAYYDSSPDLGERAHMPDAPKSCLVCLLPPILDRRRLGSPNYNLDPCFFECEISWPRTPSSSAAASSQPHTSSTLSNSTAASQRQPHELPDGWSILNVLLRVRMRPLSPGLHEIVAASSDVGHVMVHDDGGVQWSLPRSTSTAVAGRQSTVDAAVPAPATFPSTRDFSTSRLPVMPASRTSDGGGLDASVVTPRATEQDTPRLSAPAASNSQALHQPPASPSRIPSPKFKVSSPRKEKRVASRTSAATVESDGAGLAGSAYFPAPQSNDSAQPADAGAAAAGGDRPAANGAEVTPSADLSSYRLHETDHATLRSVAEDVGKLSSMLQSYMSPLQQVRVPLASESLRRSPLGQTIPAPPSLAALSLKLRDRETRSAYAAVGINNSATQNRHHQRMLEAAAAGRRLPVGLEAAHQIATMSASIQGMIQSLSNSTAASQESEPARTAISQQQPLKQSQSPPVEPPMTGPGSAAAIVLMHHLNSLPSAAELAAGSDLASRRGSLQPLSASATGAAQPPPMATPYVAGHAADSTENISELASRLKQKIQSGMVSPPDVKAAVSFAAATSIPTRLEARIIEALSRSQSREPSSAASIAVHAAAVDEADEKHSSSSKQLFSPLPLPRRASMAASNTTESASRLSQPDFSSSALLDNEHRHRQQSSAAATASALEAGSRWLSGIALGSHGGSDFVTLVAAKARAKLAAGAVGASPDTSVSGYQRHDRDLGEGIRSTSAASSMLHRPTPSRSHISDSSARVAAVADAEKWLPPDLFTAHASSAEQWRRNPIASTASDVTVPHGGTSELSGVTRSTAASLPPSNMRSTDSRSFASQASQPRGQWHQSRPNPAQLKSSNDDADDEVLASVTFMKAPDISDLLQMHQDVRAAVASSMRAPDALATGAPSSEQRSFGNHSATSNIAPASIYDRRPTASMRPADAAAVELAGVDGNPLGLLGGAGLGIGSMSVPQAAAHPLLMS